MESETSTLRRYAGPIFAACVISLSVASVIGWADTRIKAQDYRPFATIVEQCKAKGFVQNAQVRVVCDLERPLVARAADIPVEPSVRKKR